MNSIYKIIFTSALLIFPLATFAMESTNYKINADAIGAGGGFGSSTNFKLNDTLGESVAGIGSSASFKAQQGFQYMVNTGLSLTIDSATRDLGNVIAGSSANGQSTLTVTTDSWGGYDLLASENHAMLNTDAVTTIPDYGCPISGPCDWFGAGLGFTILSGTGVEAKWATGDKYAGIPTSATVFHSKNGFNSGGDQTVVGYLVVPSVSQKSGTYSNVITYTALAKL